jgi:hypothetical protein
MRDGLVSGKTALIRGHDQDGVFGLGGGAHPLFPTREAANKLLDNGSQCNLLREPMCKG